MRIYPLHLSLIFVLLLTLAIPAMNAEAASQKKAYSGNPQSLKYHNSDCKYFNSKGSTVSFESAKEAKKKGFVACKVCGG